MRRRSLTRRRFLASAGASGAALALGTGASAASAAPLEQAAEGITPRTMGDLAQYAAIPLAPDRAAELATLLAGALSQLRALRTDGYGDLEPAVVFRVPPEG